MKKIKLFLPLIITASTAFSFASMTSCSKEKVYKGTTVEQLTSYLDNHKILIGNGENFSSSPINDPSVIGFMNMYITQQLLLNQVIYALASNLSGAIVSFFKITKNTFYIEFSMQGYQYKTSYSNINNVNGSFSESYSTYALVNGVWNEAVNKEYDHFYIGQVYSNTDSGMQIVTVILKKENTSDWTIEFPQSWINATFHSN